MSQVNCNVEDCKYCIDDKCTKDVIEMGENPDYFGDGPHTIVGMAECQSIIDKDWGVLSEDEKQEYFKLKKELKFNGWKWMEEKYGKGVRDKLYGIKTKKEKETETEKPMKDMTPE